MSPINNIEKIESFNINDKLKNLENNSFSFWLEQTWEYYSNLPEQKIKNFLLLCNNVISNDKNIIGKKIDFLKTVEENTKIS